MSGRPALAGRPLTSRPAGAFIGDAPRLALSRRRVTKTRRVRGIGQRTKGLRNGSDSTGPSCSLIRADHPSWSSCCRGAKLSRRPSVQPRHRTTRVRRSCRGSRCVQPGAGRRLPGNARANCGNRWMRPRRRDEPRASRETRVGRRPDAVHRPTQLVARLSAVQFDGEGDKAASRDAAKQVSARFATTDEHDEQLLARRCWEATLPVHPQLGPSVGTGLGLRRD